MKPLIPLRRLLCSVLLVILLGCTVYNTPAVTEVARPRPGDSVFVYTPVKAHLLDGSTVVYRGTILFWRDSVRSLAAGKAYRFGLSLADSAPADALPLDSIVAMESYRNSVNGPATAVATTLGIVGGTVAAVGLAVAIYCASNPKCFGSCPTFYSDSAGTPVLEAEGFSYSIAPLFEGRDVDRLRARPDDAGDLRLEVRNEALETHYINQLGLLEVRHTGNEIVIPDGGGHPLAVRAFVPPATARDRVGRDVRSDLLAADGVTFSTDSQAIADVSASDPTDYVDLSFPVPPGGDSVALVLRMRNSLLNTVLLYEMMLADPGARAIDWMGQELDEVGPAALLGRWYARRMGMRVAVRDGDGYREVTRIPDTGPVAWKDVAVLVPVPMRDDSLHVRLEFVADDWRIDQVQLALGARRASARALEPAEVLDADGRSDTAALASVRGVDERYLVTSPGQRFTLRFATGPAPTDSVRTFLLVSDGYYIEWLRTAWLRGPHTATTFQPSDEALVAALRRWRAERTEYEHRFASTRVPVR